MVKKRCELFKKGDVIRTNPEPHFYGIAVVLDDGVKLEIAPGKWSYPMCHIAITSLLYDFEVTMGDLDVSKFRPLLCNRCYHLKNTPEFYREELMIHIYTTRNVAQLPVIGNIDPSLIYQGKLDWKPGPDRFFWCGDISSYFGREAYLNWYDTHKL